MAKARLSLRRNEAKEGEARGIIETAGKRTEGTVLGGQEAEKGSDSRGNRGQGRITRETYFTCKMTTDMEKEEVVITMRTKKNVAVTVVDVAVQNM